MAQQSVSENVNSQSSECDVQQASNLNVKDMLVIKRSSHANASHYGSHADGYETDEDQVDGENVNAFAFKKTLVQGMMDVALITANANQLRYIIEFNSNSKTYHFVFTMILISILLQLIVGISLIWMGKKGYHDQEDEASSEQQYHVMLCNKFVLIAVFFITVINVFIATFPINA